MKWSGSASVINSTGINNDKKRVRSISKYGSQFDRVTNYLQVITQKYTNMESVPKVVYQPPAPVKPQPLIMTFEIKVSTRPDRAPLKLKVSEHEDKEATVREFCKTYKIRREKEEIIRAEVIKYFEKRSQGAILSTSSVV